MLEKGEDLRKDSELTIRQRIMRGAQNFVVRDMRDEGRQSPLPPNPPGGYVNTPKWLIEQEKRYAEYAIVLEQSI